MSCRGVRAAHRRRIYGHTVAVTATVTVLCMSEVGSERNKVEYNLKTRMRIYKCMIGT